MADLVARRMTQNSDWGEAEETEEVGPVKELEQRELCRNLHGLEVLYLVGSPLTMAWSLEQRRKPLMEGNVQPQLQG